MADEFHRDKKESSKFWNRETRSRNPDRMVASGPGLTAGKLSVRWRVNGRCLCNAYARSVMKRSQKILRQYFAYTGSVMLRYVVSSCNL